MAEVKEFLGFVGYCVAQGVLNYACCDYFILGERGQVARMSREVRAGWAGAREGWRTFFRGSRETVEAGDASLGEAER